MSSTGSSPYNLFIPNKQANDQPAYGTDMRQIEIAHNNFAANTTFILDILQNEVHELFTDTNITQVVSWMVGGAPPVGTRLTAYYGYTNVTLNASGEGFITIPGGGYTHGYTGFMNLAGTYQPGDLPNVILNLWHDNSSLTNFWCTVSYNLPNPTLNIPATPYFSPLQITYAYGQQPGANPSPSVNVTFLTIGA